MSFRVFTLAVVFALPLEAQEPLSHPRAQEPQEPPVQCRGEPGTDACGMRLLTEFAGYYRIAGHEEYKVGPAFGVTFHVGLHSALGLSVFGAVGQGSNSGGLMARYRRFLPGGWVAGAAVGPTLWGTRSGIVGDISLLYKNFVGYSDLAP